MQNRPLYDTGWRVGMPLPGQGKKHEAIQSTLAIGRTRIEDHRECRYLGNNAWSCGHIDQSEICDCHVCWPFVIEERYAFGMPAAAQNGLLDGKVYTPSTAQVLADAMNRIAHKSTTGVHHWVTEGMIHWAFLSRNMETGVITIRDWGAL